MKIMIAEDDSIARRVLQLTLEQFGHEAVATADGQQAWEAFDREPVRIVVSDWMMPGIDGLALCKKIRERAKTEYTYFILLTATSTTSENYTHAMEAGIDDFLTKPMDRDMIRTRLHVAQRILSFTTQVQQLNELLPICAYCHRIRDDRDYWEKIETYIEAHTGSNFSHGVCPECLEIELAKLNETPPV